jgi:hypothetical protein
MWQVYTRPTSASDFFTQKLIGTPPVMKLFNYFLMQNVGYCRRTFAAFFILERQSKMAAKSKMTPEKAKILFLLPNGQKLPNFKNVICVLFVLLVSIINR